MTCEVVGTALAPVVLDGLSISGTWTNDTQYVNRAVDTTGLTILAHYSDGTTDTLANAGLTFGGVKQSRGGNDYYSSNWMYEKTSNDTPVTLYAVDTNDVKYEGTSPNISILGEIANPPQTATATVYVGDAGDNLLGTFQNACYGGYFGFYIDTDTSQPIEPSSTHPAFWYVISKADYDNDVLLGTAAQGLMTLMGDYGFDMTSDHDAEWGPEGARVNTDFACYMPTDGTGTLASDTDYMYVIARKDNATSGTSVATYKPSDLTELVKIVVTAKPGHAPTP